MAHFKFLRSQIVGIPSWMGMVRMNGSRADYLRALVSMGVVFVISEILKITYHLPSHIAALTAFFLMIGVCYAYQRRLDAALRTAALATVSFVTLSPVVYGSTPLSEYIDFIGLCAAIAITALAVHALATSARTSVDV